MSTGMRSSTTTVSQRPSTKNLMAWIPCSTHEKCTSPCRRPGFAAAIAEGHRRQRHCYRREGETDRRKTDKQMGGEGNNTCINIYVSNSPETDRQRDGQTDQRYNT